MQAVMTKNELESKICELKNLKDQHVLKKREIELHLLKCKNQVRGNGKLPNDKYRSICDAQQKFSNQMLHNDRSIASINKELRALSDEERKLEFESKNEISNGHAAVTVSVPIPELIPELIRELVNLRQHYQDFASDLTRISSMRQMASEFVGKLNPIIRKSINKP